MRPARTILLCGEGDLSDLRFCLSHAKRHPSQPCYKVVTAKTTTEAVSAMEVLEFDLLLCQLPFVGVDLLLKEAKEKHGARVTMVIVTKTGDREGLLADIQLFKPARWDLLERIKILTIRKRGPARGFKARREEICAK
jgi:DNA-binding response OmpR family regulator